MKIDPVAFLNVAVYGRPIPQGSKAPGPVIKGHSTMREDNPATKPWRAHVVSTIQAKYPLGVPEPVTGPVMLRIVFGLQSPKTVPSERNGYPSTEPDIDKMERAINDALTMSGIWKDDGQVVDSHTTKLYIGHPECKLRAPGAWIRVYRILRADAG